MDIPNHLLVEVSRLTEDEVLEDKLLTESRVLKVIASKPVDKKLLLEKIPQTSLSKSRLFTGS